MNKQRGVCPLTSSVCASLHVLIGVAILSTLLTGETFLSFSIKNSRQQAVNIAKINTANGIVIKSIDLLAPQQIGSFWGVFPKRKISMVIVTKDDREQTHLACELDRQGSDSCLVEIHDNTVECECFQ